MNLINTEMKLLVECKALMGRARVSCEVWPGAVVSQELSHAVFLIKIYSCQLIGVLLSVALFPYSILNLELLTPIFSELDEPHAEPHF